MFLRYYLYVCFALTIVEILNFKSQMLLILANIRQKKIHLKRYMLIYMRKIT